MPQVSHTDVLSMDHVSCRRGSIAALTDVSLRVRRGESVALAGESGSGKSALLSCLYGETMPSHGSVHRATDSVALLWQEPALCENLDVATNLALTRPLDPTLRNVELQRWARMQLNALGLAGQLDSQATVGSLTLAKRELVSLAQVLSTRADVLLLDFPTCYLGQDDTDHVIELLSQRHRQGQTMVIASYRVEEMFALCDRIVVLRAGQVVGEVDTATGHPDDVLDLQVGRNSTSSARRRLASLSALSDQLAGASPTSVVQLVLSSLAAALGDCAVALHVLDAGRLRLAGEYGLPDHLRRLWSNLPVSPDANPIGEVLLRHDRVTYPDIRRAPAWSGFFMDAWGANIASSWSLPVRATHNVLAVLTVCAPSIGLPDTDEVYLAALYSSHLATALEHERLVAELSQRNQMLETMRSVLDELSRPGDFTSVLTGALVELRRGLGCRKLGLFERTTQGPQLLVGVNETALTEQMPWPSGMLTQDAGWAWTGSPDHSVAAVVFSAAERIQALVAYGLPDAAAARPLLDDTARSIGLFAERRRAQAAEEQARASQKSQDLTSQFLHQLSHELRTPLTAIEGYAESLLQSDVSWDAESQQRFLARISSESRRMHRLVDDLLDQSAIEAGALRLVLDWCDLKLLLDAAIAVLPHDARRRIEVTIDENVPPLWADHDRLEQVFVNLLDNATRHNPLDTRVWVRAWCPDASTVCVTVADNGLGLPPEIAGNPFSPHRNRSRSSSGSGLGLSILAGIIASHAGTISVDATPGTTFTIRLPLPGDDQTEPEGQELV